MNHTECRSHPSFQMSRSLGAMLLALLVHVNGCVVVMGSAAVGGAAGVAAAVKGSQDADYSPTTYVGTVLANVVYFPAKVIFASAGAATTGLTYVVTAGQKQPARSIWTSTVTGDYVVTPSMIAGHQPVEFVGAGTVRG